MTLKVPEFHDWAPLNRCVDPSGHPEMIKIDMLQIFKFNGRGSAINRALDGTTYLS